MKANAPDKLYYAPYGDIREDYPITVNDIEYIRKDAFIEKALKWYCLDCECNDNCKSIKCFFYREFERYLNGGEHALPPKISNSILDEDGFISANWQYRHFAKKIQDTFIEKACYWLKNHYNEDTRSYLIDEDIEKFINYMKKVEL